MKSIMKKVFVSLLALAMIVGIIGVQKVSAGLEYYSHVDVRIDNMKVSAIKETKKGDITEREDLTAEFTSVDSVKIVYEKEDDIVLQHIVGNTHKDEVGGTEWGFVRNDSVKLTSDKEGGYYKWNNKEKDKFAGNFEKIIVNITVTVDGKAVTVPYEFVNGKFKNSCSGATSAEKDKYQGIDLTLDDYHGTTEVQMYSVQFVNADEKPLKNDKIWVVEGGNVEEKDIPKEVGANAEWTIQYDETETVYTNETVVTYPINKATVFVLVEEPKPEDSTASVFVTKRYHDVNISKGTDKVVTTSSIEIDESITVGGVYTATKDDMTSEFDGYEYDDSNETNTTKIENVAESGNEIILNFVKKFVDVVVTHEYYLDDKLTESTTDSAVEKAVGESFTATPIVKDGYTLTSTETELTILKVDEQNKSITLRYDKKSPAEEPITPPGGNGGNGGGSYFIPIPPTEKKEEKKEEVIEIVPEIVPEAPVEEVPVEEEPEVPAAPVVEEKEEVKEEVQVEIPEVPEALPKTGTAAVEWFFGLGSFFMTIGAAFVMFARRKQN